MDLVFFFWFVLYLVDSIEGFSRCRRYYNILWTTVLLRQLCKKRLAVLPPPTPPSPRPPPPPPPLLLLLCCCWAAAVRLLAAVLLLSCCFCHIGIPLLRVPKKYDAVLRNANLSFLFSVRDLFVFLLSDGISAIRSSQTYSKWCRNEFWPFSSSIELLVELFHSVN